MANLARFVSSTLARLKPRLDAPEGPLTAFDDFPPEVAVVRSREGALAFDKRRSARSNPLEEFPPEGGPIEAPDLPRPPSSGPAGPAWLLPVAGATVLAAAATLLWAFWATRTPATGSLRIESNPPAAAIVVDGQPQGSTPATLSLAPGPHAIVIQHAGAQKALNVDVAANTTIVHHVELPSVAAAAATGSLQVNTSAPATVSVDGTARGSAPLTIDNLAPGAHRVAVTIAGTTYNRDVQIQAGQTVSLLMGATPAVASAAAPGWLTARTPLPFTIAEDGQVVGTTESPRILLPAGTHQFEFRNDALGYRTTMSVRIDPGRVTTIQVPLAQAPVQINALPWAEVWIDGQRVGETPLANVMQTIGPHEIVFRHPQLGEKRVTTLVTLSGPARATVDMRTP